jgi:hypothetical protein
MLEISLILAGLCVGELMRYFGYRGRFGLFSRIANHRCWSVVLCAAVAMVPRLALLPWLPPPQPMIEDEFSYLLGAHTLALGRLTNPTPALWQHFESFHINLVPSYQSMYPPGSSLFYALGLIVGGNPWWGVWLATGLMAGAICWALQPLVRPRYALLAGLIVACRYGVFSLFSDSYWGGAISALGGALTVGAFARLVDPRPKRSAPKLRHAVLLVIGVALLANTRPFEGFLCALPVAAALLTWIVKQRQYARVLAPALALLAILAAAMGYYNMRGTGSPLKMPYIANFEQYHYVPPLIGLRMKPLPDYRHQDMALQYARLEAKPARLARTPSGLWKLTKQKLDVYYKNHFRPLIALALIGLVVALRLRRRRILAYTFLFVACGLLVEVWYPQISYPAPLLVSFSGLAMVGLRYLQRVSIGRHRLGFYWSRGMVVVLLLSSVVALSGSAEKGIRSMTKFPLAWNMERARVINDLSARGGEHLVIVRLFSDSDRDYDWVYNSPEIDKQPVIFARWMSNAENCELIRHYSNRQVWLLQAERRPWTVLIPFGSRVIDPHCD